MSKKRSTYRVSPTPGDVTPEEDGNQADALIREVALVSYQAVSPALKSAIVDDPSEVKAVASLWEELDATMDRILTKSRAIRQDIDIVRGEIAATRTLG